MKELKVLNHDGTLVVDSRDVANMIGKQHAHLLRDIQGYIQILEKSNERKIALCQFLPRKQLQGR